MSHSNNVYAWSLNWVVCSREKRNLTALTPQFKIKYSLKWEELVRVAYANFSEVNVQAKLVRERKQGSEDIILVDGKSDSVKTLFLLVGEQDGHEDTIFAGDHLDPFHPVQKLKNINTNNF